MPTTSRGFFPWLFRSAAILEDLADRLSHVWTVGLLLVMAAIISWRQLAFNQPIACMTPSHFPIHASIYAETTCWNKGLFTIPIFDFGGAIDLSIEINVWLYKWLPIILVIQALLFKLPNIVLTVLHGYSGISFEKIAGLTKGYSQLNIAERTLLGRQIGRYVYNWCSQCENCLPWRLLTLNWLLVKVLFCINAAVQMNYVDKFLSTRIPPFDNSTSYGDVIYDNLFNKNATEWKISPVFPRTVMCDYSLVQLQSTQKYKIQCDLQINELQEHVFMVIWVWLICVAIISFISLLMGTLITLLPFSRKRYLARMLNLSDETQKADQNANFDQFATMVGEDGVTVLKLIASNSSELLVRDAVSTMYHLKMMSQRGQYTYVQDMTSYPAQNVPPTSYPVQNVPPQSVPAPGATVGIEQAQPYVAGPKQE